MVRGPERYPHVPRLSRNAPNLVEEFSAGDTICGSCGRVLSERGIDTRSEWRTFSNDDQGNDDPLVLVTPPIPCFVVPSCRPRLVLAMAV